MPHKTRFNLKPDIILALIVNLIYQENVIDDIISYISTRDSIPHVQFTSNIFWTEEFHLDLSNTVSAAAYLNF